MSKKERIGIDTGGTFTDFVHYEKGTIAIQKLPSTPKNPAAAILEGIGSGNREQATSEIVHGTTVATNALLEKKGGRIALVTTAGFEDILFIGRQTRRQLFSLQAEERIPLLPPEFCLGISERVTAKGKILKSVSENGIEHLRTRLVKLKVEAVAICLINAYINPQNERKVLKALQPHFPLVTASHQILPEYREFERTTVTTVNAYLMPVMSRYLENLEENLSHSDLRVMQSNEGYIAPGTARTQPIRTALSGPAGGVVASFRIAKDAGFKRIITFDMGGTSSDVSLIDHTIQRTNESSVGEFPIRLPIIDIHTVGAGGGSLAYLDKGGSLRVGPQSAGADPGPACYGKGERATVTDANLVLGRLVPEFFLGGKMRIFPERSKKSIAVLARQMGKSLEASAEGILEIANANMEKAIRVISIERGIDPRSFSLFSFGGAGGMHAAEMAAHLDLSTVVIPKNAGVLSALGLLMADSIRDYSQSMLTPADKVKPSRLEQIFEKVSRQGLRDMKQEGFPPSRIRIEHALDLRYQGQSYEITVPYRSDGAYIAQFHKQHKRLYSYQQPHQPVEIVTLRVKATGLSRKIRLQKQPLGRKNPQAAVLKSQVLHYRGKEYQALVYERSRLEPGNVISGPALVVDVEATTFLPPRSWLQVDEYLNLVLHRKR
jgi:N-methylhydantoinase A/oxoprolinase/acetone carboxylase beta subunit